MFECKATVTWQRGEQLFRDNKYSRGHRWIFDGGATVEASSSPEVVPLPYSVAENVDPEEAFLASLSSCHMLFFLAFAAKQYTVDEYTDQVIGVVGKNVQGKTAITSVTLRPAVTFSGAEQPDRDEVLRLHHKAHEACFIANSVNTEIVIEPQ